MSHERLRENLIRAQYMEHAVLMSLMDVYRKADADARRYLEVEILETMTHREIMKALQRSFDEFERLGGIPEGKLSMREVVDHLRNQEIVETDAERFYSEQAALAPTPFLRGLFDLISRDERLHHDILEYAPQARESLREVVRGSSCVVEGSPGSNFAAIVRIVLGDLGRRIFVVRTREEVPRLSEEEILILPSYYEDRDRVRTRKEATALATRLSVEIAGRAAEGSAVVLYYASDLAPAPDLAYEFWDNAISVLRRSMRDVYLLLVCAVDEGGGCDAVYPLVDYVVQMMDVDALLYKVRKVSP
ncbi:hypothetical protein [Conexivisphaera calida]|uniref:Rubrerythrin diiron-binding domain-containing protein n=1 Tax=Conexivisphaera calida TaxID=1874277 RepID=A0A4P2VLR9_9ARCH|nr:hypothetical protein [Conexivisphaera calida]BBE42048.1 hypothetical protein NAS2_0659 [Conexivisphaera calida]